MTERAKDLVAGIMLMGVIVGLILGGWAMLRLMGHEGARRLPEACAVITVVVTSYGRSTSSAAAAGGGSSAALARSSPIFCWAGASAKNVQPSRPQLPDPGYASFSGVVTPLGQVCSAWILILMTS